MFGGSKPRPTGFWRANTVRPYGNKVIISRQNIYISIVGTDIPTFKPSPSPYGATSPEGRGFETVYHTLTKALRARRGKSSN